MITLHCKHTFNTGRGYTENGQEITLSVTAVENDNDPEFPGFQQVVVKFNDASRGIIGTVKFTVVDETLQQQENRVMSLYDSGNYQ